MKIGELSCRTGVSRDTLRFYMKEELLQPERQGEQFDFSESDERDVDFILRMRDMDFSLHDIRTLLTLRRLSSEEDRNYRKKCAEIMQRQQTRLESSIRLLGEKASRIHQVIEKLEAPMPVSRPVSGLPLAALPLLTCPECGLHLNIEGASLTARGVISGDLRCPCGYAAEIRDGILQTPHQPTTLYDRPDLDRGLHLQMPEEVALLHQKTYETITAGLKSLGFGGMICMETNINNTFYLYTHRSAAAQASLYIVTDKYREMLQMYKDCLDQLDLPFEVMYIADDSTRFPLKNGSVDFFIDCMASFSHSLYSQSFLTGEMCRYLKKSGVVLGTFIYFSPGAETLANIGCKYPERNPAAFTFSYFKTNLEQYYPYVSIRKVGTVQHAASDRYTLSCHVDGEDWSTASYLAAQGAVFL